jgi:hypothetical protein
VLVLVAALEDNELAAFDLGHDAGEGLVDDGVEGGVGEEVVCDVDGKTFVRGDGGRDVGEEGGEGWEGAGGQVAA